MSDPSAARPVKSFLWALLLGPLLTIFLGGLPFIPLFLQRIRNGYFISLGLIVVFMAIPKGRAFLLEKFFPWISWKLENDFRYWYWFLGLQFIVIIKVVLLNYFSLNVNAIDYSFYDYLIPATFNGKPFYSPACDCNHFAIHSTFTHFILLAPHAIFKHPLFSNIMHGIIIWSAWLPLYLIGKHYKLRKNHLFLLIFGMLNLNLVSHILSYNYHVEVAYFPLFLWLFYAFETNQRMLFYIMALLIAGVKEDGAVYLAAFPIAAFFIDKRRPYWTLPLIFISACIFYINLKIIIPSQAEGTYKLTEAVGKYGSNPAGIISAVLSSPIQYIKDFFSSGWPKYLLAFAWTPLLIPFFLLSTGPYVLIHSLAASEVMRKYGLYYGSPFLPFCMYALILFLSNETWLDRRISLKKVKIWMPTFFLVWALYFGGGSFRFVPFLKDYFQIKTTLDSLPPNAKICAQGSHFPLLSYNMEARLISDKCIEDPFDFLVLSDKTNPYPYQTEKIQEMIIRLRTDSRFELHFSSQNMLVFKRKI